MSDNLLANAARKLLPEAYSGSDKQKDEAERAFAKIFGVEYNPLKRLFGKGKSKLLTKEQIAQKLLDNSLVSNLEEGMKETEHMLRKKSLWVSLPPRTEFREYPDGNGDKKYRLHFVDTPLIDV